MKEVITIYKKHKINVDNFISTVIKSFPSDYIGESDYILKNNKYVQLLYSVDKEYKQISPVICKKEKYEAKENGRNKVVCS